MDSSSGTGNIVLTFINLYVNKNFRLLKNTTTLLFNRKLR